MPELIPEEELMNRGSSRRGVQFILAKYNPLSSMLQFAAIIIQLYIITKYPRADFIYYSYILIGFGLISIIGLAIITRGDIYYQRLPFTEPGVVPKLKYIVGIPVSMFAILFFMMIFQIIPKLSVTAEDLYLYYGASAILEESFFRMFLISLFVIKWERNSIKLYLGVLISSIAFAFAHIAVYGQSIFLMLTMFFYGLILAITFVLIQDITVPMIVHLILNLIAVGNILVQT